MSYRQHQQFIGRLTDASIARHVESATATRLYDLVVPGLYLIGPDTLGRWTWFYASNERCAQALGNHPAMSLDEARDKADSKGWPSFHALPQAVIDERLAINKRRREANWPEVIRDTKARALKLNINHDDVLDDDELAYVQKLIDWPYDKLSEADLRRLDRIDTAAAVRIAEQSWQSKF